MAHPGIDVIRQLLGDTRQQESTILERRQGLAELAGSVPAPDGIVLEVIELADRRTEQLTPPSAAEGETILYLHGGAYTAGSPDTHRGLASALALASGRRVVVLDYRLAPEDPFPAGLNDALLAFDQLAPDRVALAGDSAGGGLAAATALAFRDRGGAQPVAVALISPWADLTQSAGSYTSRAELDPMLTAAVLTQSADAYLAGTDARTPYASPVFGDLAGLPPMRVDVGSDEVLFDDSASLVANAQAAGTEAELHEWPNMIHVFPAFPPELVPEAAEAVAAMGAFLAAHLNGRELMGIYREQVLPRLVELTCGGAQMERWRARATEGLHGRIVEIGFGSGLNVPVYPAAVTEVLTVEPAHVARERAAGRIAASHATITNVGLDGQVLPIEDDSCEGALSTFTLCTIPDAAAALAELRRVLKPGGELHFLEHGLSPDPKIARWQHRLDPIEQRLADGCHLTRDPVAMVEAAGFTMLHHDSRYAKGPKPWTWMTTGIAAAP